MGFGERVQWFGRLALLIFILASVAFLSALTAMRFAIQGRELKMPALVGQKAADAQASLQKIGLGMRIEDRVYSTLPVDTIVRQSPPARIRLKVGQRAHVVLSLGTQKVTIPDLEAQSMRAARIQLLRGGMQVGELSSVYLPSLPTDTVAKQDPTPGTSDAASPHVDLLVSLGPRPPAYIMPDLLGLSLADADARLGSAGLKAGKITVKPVPGAIASVTAQAPRPGARVDSSMTIELEVAE